MSQEARDISQPPQRVADARMKLGGLVLDALRASRDVSGTEIPIAPTTFEVFLAPADFVSIRQPRRIEHALERLVTIRAQGLCLVLVGEIEVRLRPLAGVRVGFPEIVAGFRQEEHAMIDRLSGRRGGRETHLLLIKITEGVSGPQTPEPARPRFGVRPL